MNRTIRVVSPIAIFSLVALASSPLYADEVERTMIPGMVMKLGDGTPRTVHPTNAKIKVSGHRLIGADDKVLATLVRRSEVETVGSYSFSPDGRYLAVGIHYDSVRGGKDGTIRGYLRLYSVESGAMLWDSGAPVIGPVVHVSFSKDGNTVFYRSGRVEFVGGK